MATNNAGKLREARAIAGDKIEILSLDDIGYRHDIAETADTLSGNAQIKARTIKEETGYDCFADDTGLIVDALGGAPGVYSARYAGEDCDPERNIDLLLRNMEGKSERTARFKTCVALELGDEEHLFEGSCEGSIATRRSGSHGFGYDPVFVSAESGRCFADMTDEEKNGISHRGRALRAMMRWLGALCLLIFAVLPAGAQSNSDWRLHNTFDDKVENIFDTPDKTYFLVEAQYYNSDVEDNDVRLCFLFTLDKESDEVRAYNRGNFLSHSLIRTAYYNAEKHYLLIVYDDLTIDLLHDDGSVQSIQALKSYLSSGSKEVRGISFAPELNKAYLATDFGFIAIDDNKAEIASSGIYNTPIDRAVRAGDRLLLLKDGKILQSALAGNHLSLSDFTETDWDGGSLVSDLISLSPTKCMFVKKSGWREDYYILDFGGGGTNPQINEIGPCSKAAIAENKEGVLLTNGLQLVQINRETGQPQSVNCREEDNQSACGSWDLSEVFFAKPRTGFYSLKRTGDSWTTTREAARPNSPAVFRSNSMQYTSDLGMLVNTHGIDTNFPNHNAPNPILLSGLQSGQWNMYGLPYEYPEQALRIINPCGFTRDPDNPNQFYFGSTLNGVLRYDITGATPILHMTRSNDTPNLEGHVSVQAPYSDWGNSFILPWPQIDMSGNMVVAHINTEEKNSYKPELWIWSTEDRKGSTTAENFKPFKKIPIKGLGTTGKLAKAIPLTTQGRRNMIIYMLNGTYGKAFMMYDHNGTIDNESDDRQAIMSSLYDQDGTVSYNYIYCATEDPATGLVWVGTDNGVFTFNPDEAFTTPGKVSRIKVSRNDGTSLADYLLNGIAINDISIDGQGRKWFSLASGGIVCTSSDGKTIIKEITSENSLLPSDNVYATCYNPANNSMMIATSAGICENFLSGQANDTGKSDVRAYPNPVAPDYYGYVTIDGLEDGSFVKICDSAGNIIREIGPAQGGSVQWDVCGFDLNRVESGVYFVLASSGPGNGNFSEATKVLVINR